MTITASTQDALEFQLRFQSLFHDGRGLAFPCDAEGKVRMDELSNRARCNYLFARAMVGMEFTLPEVIAASAAEAMGAVPIASR